MGKLHLSPILLLLPFCIACNNDQLYLEEALAFNARETTAKLSDEEGRIKFHCADTAFIYLQTSGNSPVNLVIDDPEVITTFFSEIWPFTVVPENSCTLLDELTALLQDHELHVRITGDIKKGHPGDQVPLEQAVPFVVQHLEKVSTCRLDPPEKEGDFTLVGTTWQVLEVRNDQGVFYPACEFQKVSFTLTREVIPNEPDFSEVRLETGMDNCLFGYKYDKGQVINFKRMGCSWGLDYSTKDVVDFHQLIMDLIYPAVEGHFEESVQFELQNNYLALKDINQRVEVLLFASGS